MDKQKGNSVFWSLVYFILCGGMLIASGIYIDKILSAGFSPAAGFPAVGFGLAGLGILAFLLFNRSK